MTGKILIVDSVATNRIILKVKLVAAQYDVETCATSSEANVILNKNRPDLVLVNLSNPIENLHDFCQQTRSRPDGRSMAIVGVGVADTSRARFAALDCGCDDVLPLGSGDAYMHARLRSLLRRHSAVLAWQLQGGSQQPIGFEEDSAPAITPPHITVVSNTPSVGSHIVSSFQHGLGQSVRLMTQDFALSMLHSDEVPDLLIIDGSNNKDDIGALHQMIADVKARSAAHNVAHMVLIPKGHLDIGALLLDLGADDVVEASASPQELCLRARALLKQKLQNDALREQVRSGLEAAVIDPLTGLHNRRFADRQMDEMARHSTESGQGYAVMMVDIDHFKTINDTYGHHAGDMVLTEIATRFRDNFREIDLIARIGGEEFLIAMPDTDATQAQIVAERLRKVVGNKPFALPDNDGVLKVTISVGVAMGGFSSLSHINTEALYARADADAALYSAKGAGRDTVVMAQAAA